jgi:hypothetical protein
MQTRSHWTVGIAVVTVLVAVLGLATPRAWAQSQARADRLSAMGRVAARARVRIASLAPPPAPRVGGAIARLDADETGRCVNEPDCEDGLRDGAARTQSELSIAIDRSGQHVVIGFNDFRGFATSPVSVSGFMYSSDGGQTFTDGGQLPVTTGTTTVGGTLIPQIFGDPDVTYLGDCTFVYSSILLTKLGANGLVQTMGVHRSTDCGHTWQGPYEVQAATNPSGRVDVNGDAFDAADKEFMDVDPETGRLMMTWTNFGATSIQMRSALSDDGGLTWPVAKGAIISETADDGQATIPRFARGSHNAYVAWSRFPEALAGYGNVIAFARSTDDGVTWQAPIELSDPFLTEDLILGNDRSNTSPSLAVDRSSGRFRGSIYVVYANNNSNDGSDIAFQKSTDRGATFSAPMLINARPGADRAQWFPWVTVDDTTGRISVFYYDQGIASTGDLSEVSYLFSNDGGRTWEHPRPLTRRPFHAGHGNDTGQPNLGDYNQAVAQGGQTWFAYAIAERPPLGFEDGQPLTTMTVPDATVTIVSPWEYVIPHEPVSLQHISTRSRGGSADPGEPIALRLPLFNYATNPLYARDVRQATGWLTTDTAGVRVTRGVSQYPRIEPGRTRSNLEEYVLTLDRSFTAGTPIELTLTVLSSSGFAVLRHTLDTGTPVKTTILTEDFQSVEPGSLPVGWTASHGASGVGVSAVPWTTSSTFCGGSNGAFHQNANDASTGQSPARWERLFSPAFVVPPDAEYVELEFDVCYNTEDDPVLPITAYDGFFLRIADLTTGRTVRSVLAEAFADEIVTDGAEHYPKHLPRSSNTSYFEDMSAWAGDSGGIKHVRMRLPGMQGSTAQLRFEFTQDSLFTCRDVRPTAPACGVFIDNVTVNSVVSSASPAPVGPVDEPDEGEDGTK